AAGGDDPIIGGKAGYANFLYGDAEFVFDSAKGGNDTITGGDAGGTTLCTAMDLGCLTVQRAATMCSPVGMPPITSSTAMLKLNAKGGDDTLIAGEAMVKFLYGDAHEMYGYATGGNDRLVSGPGNDEMWGDAHYKAPTVVTGADVFVFLQNNGQDTIHDFEQGKDHIDLTALTNLM